MNTTGQSEIPEGSNNTQKTRASSNSKINFESRRTSMSRSSSALRVDLANPDPQVVDVVSRHLVQPQDISTNNGDPGARRSSSSTFPNNGNSFTNGSNHSNSNLNNLIASSLNSNADYSLQLKGGDMTRDLYKWQSQHMNNNNNNTNISASPDKFASSFSSHNPLGPLHQRRKSFEVGSLSRKDSDNSGNPLLQHPESVLSNARNNILTPSVSAHSTGSHHFAGDGTMQNLDTTTTSNGGSEMPMMSVNEMRAPNGFRRSFILQKQIDHHQKHNIKKPYQPPNFLTRNFIEFLTIYGHFAGEDLSDDEDEESGDDDEESGDESESELALVDEQDQERATDVSSSTANETSSLLPRYTKKLSLSDDLNTRINQMIKSNMKNKKHHRFKHADRDAKKASNFKAVLLLIKSFIGTGVLFLPKSFENAGYMFAVGCLAICSLLSYYCFVILIVSRNSLNTKARLGYGELGYALYGKFFQTAVLQSIILSQIGFASAYIVFTATNLQQFFQSFMSMNYPLPIYIFLQMLVFIPLSLTRNISKLGGTALIADAFILIGLVYVIYYSSFHMVQEGGISSTVVPFNNKTWSLFIGTAIFTFEGIGLLIPIQDSMKKPHEFPKLLACVLTGSTLLFIGTGLLCYFSYGTDVKTVILLNFPADSLMTQTSQFLYAVAILLSTPLQLFPAIRILENQYVFPKQSGKFDPKVKWMKNYFRCMIVTVSCLIAYVGANDLDKFVSLVGSLACVPLIYIFPPLMHAKTHPNFKYLDYCICALGVCITIYTTSQTISMWIAK